MQNKQCSLFMVLNRRLNIQISVGNHVIPSEFWNKYARVNFFKDEQIGLVYEKYHVITYNNILENLISR